tara:strand:+ start:2933 stop:3232 length:300 start_codon:yes stop_codon:yes gene_type:complete
VGERGSEVWRDDGERGFQGRGNIERGQFDDGRSGGHGVYFYPWQLGMLICEIGEVKFGTGAGWMGYAGFDIEGLGIDMVGLLESGKVGTKRSNLKMVRR